MTAPTLTLETAEERDLWMGCYVAAADDIDRTWEDCARVADAAVRAYRERTKPPLPGHLAYPPDRERCAPPVRDELADVRERLGPEWTEEIERCAPGASEPRACDVCGTYLTPGQRLDGWTVHPSCEASPPAEEPDTSGAPTVAPRDLEAWDSEQAKGRSGESSGMSTLTSPPRALTTDAGSGTSALNVGTLCASDRTSTARQTRPVDGASAAVTSDSGAPTGPGWRETAEVIGCRLERLMDDAVGGQDEFTRGRVADIVEIILTAAQEGGPCLQGSAPDEEPTTEGWHALQVLVSRGQDGGLVWHHPNIPGWSGPVGGYSWGCLQGSADADDALAQAATAIAGMSEVRARLDTLRRAVEADVVRFDNDADADGVDLAEWIRATLRDAAKGDLPARREPTARDAVIELLRCERDKASNRAWAKVLCDRFGFDRDELQRAALDAAKGD